MSTLLEWLGTDGSTWDLRSGPVRGGLGIKGLGKIPLRTQTRQSAALDGQRRTGWQADAAPFVLPIRLGYYGLGTFADFPSLYRAWWNSLQPHLYGALRATDTATNLRRTLNLRLTDDGRELEYDVLDVEHEETVCTFEADDPWWYGDTLGAGFGAVAGGNFYGGPNGGGLGPPYYVSSANSTGGQTVANPGAIDAWPVWTILGPFTALDLYVGSSHLVLPASAGVNVLDGQRVVIDTNPQRGQTAFWLDSSGSPVAASGSSTGNITRLFSSVAFAPIPAASSASVGATITGTGQASLSFLPRYFDAI